MLWHKLASFFRARLADIKVKYIFKYLVQLTYTNLQILCCARRAIRVMCIKGLEGLILNDYYANP